RAGAASVLKAKIVVAATAPDIKAESIAGAVAERADMMLVESRVLTLPELDSLVESGSLVGPCCIVLVGPDCATEAPAASYLAECAAYVVLRVSAPLGDAVQIAACQVGLEGVLEAAHALVRSIGVRSSRIRYFRLDSAAGQRSPGSLWPFFVAPALQ